MVDRVNPVDSLVSIMTRLGQPSTVSALHATRHIFTSSASVTSRLGLMDTRLCVIRDTRLGVRDTWLGVVTDTRVGVVRNTRVGVIRDTRLGVRDTRPLNSALTVSNSCLKTFDEPAPNKVSVCCIHRQ